jgi:hypothetical protein
MRLGGAFRSVELAEPADLTELTELVRALLPIRKADLIRSARHRAV